MQVFMKKKGTLYIVATPIGNLEDITFRALRVLKEVGLIAAEDTRHTKKLLSEYGIATVLTSLHDHNEQKKTPSIIAGLNDGMDVAYVSDAGTPGISDPGYILINKAIEKGITVIPIPGASAVVAALSASGLPMDRFFFLGFPPARKGKRRHFLESLREEHATMVLYESPQRTLDTLRDIEEILGDRRVVLARELSKLYEEILRGTVSELIEALKERTIKGEITLIVSGKEKGESPGSHESVIPQFEALERGSRLSMKDIVSVIADQTGLPRKEVYNQVLKYLKARKSQ
jgi:16S rRNA (cytidine1402-2'-O)-methyltransferase